jgi:FkbM family methyltransferase
MKWLSGLFSGKGKKPFDPSRVNEVDWVWKAFAGKRDGIMVDVGSHFGESLRPFAAAGWRVLAFEPDPNPDKQHAITAALNEHSKLFHCALADRTETSMPFYRSAISTGISGLIPFHASHELAATVEAKRLCNILQDEGISHVDLLKIDTEGSDLLVLQGLQWHVKPAVIICEFEDQKTVHLHYSFRDLGMYLKDADYVVYMSEWYPVVQYGGQHQWRELKTFPCQTADEHAWGNYIAISRGFTRAWKKALKRIGVPVVTRKSP